jgi:hypothetical protein
VIANGSDGTKSATKNSATLRPTLKNPSNLHPLDPYLRYVHLKSFSTSPKVNLCIFSPRTTKTSNVLQFVLKKRANPKSVKSWSKNLLPPKVAVGAYFFTSSPNIVKTNPNPNKDKGFGSKKHLLVEKVSIGYP